MSRISLNRLLISFEEIQKEYGESYIVTVGDLIENNLKIEVNVPNKYLPTVQELVETTRKDKPRHYSSMAIDVIEFCSQNGLDFLQGNVIKYVCRYKNKGGIEDLKKAKDYLERMMDKYCESEVIKCETNGKVFPIYLKNVIIAKIVRILRYIKVALFALFLRKEKEY